MDKILNRKRATIFDTEFVFKYSEFFISAKTFSTCFYLLRKQGMSKTEIYNDLTQFQILDTTEQICHRGYEWAKNTQDVEDCMELATAYYFKTSFVTADADLFNNYQNLVQIDLVS